jgi:hypothetical protein
MRWLLLLAIVVRAAPAAGTAAELARALRENSFDRDECYRVRDITIFKEDLKIYLADGHLIFSKPLAGRRIAAAFAADVEGGDGEVILLPPNRAERTSLASFINSPNLDEHFRMALFLFTGADYDAILSQLPASAANRKDPGAAAGMDEAWTPSLRGLSASFQTRVALDLLGGAAGRPGLFAALFENARLGRFDIIFDPYSPTEQVVAGRVLVRGEQTYFDTWTSFQARSFRRSPPPRRDDVVLSDYRIQATLNPDLSLDCVTRVKVKPAVDGAAAVTFEIAPQMAVSAATVDGHEAEVLQRDSLRANIGRGGNDLFLVIPPEPLRAGREYEFELRHSGKVILDAGDRVFYVAARGNWYPMHNLQFAQYDLQFRYPVDLDLVAAGDVVEDRTEGDWRITRRRTSATIRFAAFNLGNYEHARLARAGFVLDVCANRSLERSLQPRAPEVFSVPAPGRSRRTDMPVMVPAAPAHSPLERLQALAADVASSLEFMVSKFGPPALPHIAVSPIPGTFGQGFPGLIYLSTLSYLKGLPGSSLSTAQSEQIYLEDLLQAHEVAHQWWGNRVTSTSYRDGWLMEALANTTALMYVEKRMGARSAELMLDTYRGLLLEKGSNGQTVESAGPVVFGMRLESSLAPTAYRTITYGKGAWIMQMLRRRMGDGRFLSLLAALIRRYDHRDISTGEFRQVAAEFLPPRSEDPTLETFFEQWVYGTGIPNLKLDWSVKGRAPALRLVGTVTQSGVDESFTALAPVEIQVARGQTVTEWVRTGGEGAKFTVPLKQPPLKVSLDPHYAVLRRL